METTSSKEGETKLTDHSFAVINAWFDQQYKDHQVERKSGETETEETHSRDLSSYSKLYNDNGLESRLCVVLGLLLMVIGAVPVVFLPNWDGNDTKRNGGMSVPTFSPTLAPTYSEAKEIVLTFTFDDFPNEIGWEVVDVEAGMVVDDLPSRSYEVGLKSASHRIEVVFNRAYTLNVFDDGLDGLCCNQPGLYMVSFRGVELASGEGNFGGQASHTFIIPEIVL
jgi:hypothetical protein